MMNTKNIKSKNLKITIGLFFSVIIYYINNFFYVLGKTEKTSIPSENLARQNARRSLVAKRHIPAGKKIDLEDITWKRPASGISPREIDKILGSTAAKDILEDNILQWSDIIG